MRQGSFLRPGNSVSRRFPNVARTAYDRSMTSMHPENADANRLTVGERLVAIYEGRGFCVHGGWNSHHLGGWPHAGGTYLTKDGRPLNTGGGGLCWQEIPCFELLSYCFSPRRVLVIGNSFGWSTLLISLLWPDARVVAMDIGVQPPADAAQKILVRVLSALRGDTLLLNPKPTYGIELTNELARIHQLKAEAVLSASPNDVSWVVEKHLGGQLDFAFIDGYHIPSQAVLDFDACRKVAGPDCVYLFHDVINWGLRDAFELCKKRSGLLGDILWRTPSGMGLLYPEARSELRRVFRAFGDDEKELKSAKAKLPRWKLAVWVERKVLGNRMLKRLKDAVIKPERKV